MESTVRLFYSRMQLCRGPKAGGEKWAGKVICRAEISFSPLARVSRAQGAAERGFSLAHSAWASLCVRLTGREWVAVMAPAVGGRGVRLKGRGTRRCCWADRLCSPSEGRRELQGRSDHLFSYVSEECDAPFWKDAGNSLNILKLSCRYD